MLTHETGFLKKESWLYKQFILCFTKTNNGTLHNSIGEKMDKSFNLGVLGYFLVNTDVENITKKVLIKLIIESDMLSKPVSIIIGEKTSPDEMYGVIKSDLTESLQIALNEKLEKLGSSLQIIFAHEQESKTIFVNLVPVPILVTQSDLL